MFCAFTAPQSRDGLLISCAWLFLFLSLPKIRQFTIHNSQFTIHNSQFTIHNSQFSIHNSQFTILNSQFTILNSQFSIHNSQFTIHNSQFTILNSQFAIHNSQLYLYSSVCGRSLTLTSRPLSRSKCCSGLAVHCFHSRRRATMSIAS